MTLELQTRLSEMALGPGFWPILALDHGLTVGNTNSVAIREIPDLLAGCAESFGSVVMTYGLARFARRQKDIPLIIQCFGAPLGHNKVQVCDVGDALALGASGIAVQVDFSVEADHMAYQIRAIANLVRSAHREGTPVLFMVAPHDMSGFQEISGSIRFCTELGADLIKVRSLVAQYGDEEISELREVLASSPPVVLAGGESHKGIAGEVAKAKQHGFSGYCIGRNVFQSEDPVGTACELRDVWQND